MDIINMKAKISYAFLIVLPALIYAGQTDTLMTDDRSLPVLNNHYFIPNSDFNSPFITTFFKTGIGGGTSLNRIPIYADNGNRLLGTLEGENTYVSADVQVQIKAKDWLAAWFLYQANARIGTSKPSILANGVTSITGFEFGWMLRLWQNKKNILTGTISINNSDVSALNLSRFIKDIIANPDSNRIPLREARNLLNGGAGLRYAHTFSDMAGLRAFVSASYGESMLKGNKHVWKFDSGILGSLNFSRSHNIPFGINLGYSIQKFALFEGQQEDNTYSILLKLAYTGREEYNIGMEFTHIRTAAPLIKGENTLEYVASSFVMVYYF
jgi:hypothetical protein